MFCTNGLLRAGLNALLLRAPRATEAPGLSVLKRVEPRKKWQGNSCPLAARQLLQAIKNGEWRSLILRISLWSVLWR
jgi:hypothetical protein